jgi:endo-1,4-beta-xylanase
MSLRTPPLPTILALLLAGSASHAQSPPPDPPPPVTFEAEAGLLGDDFELLESDGVRYVTTSSNGAGGSPGSPARVISYRITLPRAGLYDLYARIRVGPAAASDDSFFHARSFGEHAPTDDGAWVLANGLGTVGTSAPEAVVRKGRAPTPGWIWVNVTAFSDAAPLEVPEGKLTHTFQIGAREDGLDIERLSLAPTGISHTVAELEQQRAGRFIPAPPPPPPFTPEGPPLAHGKSKFLGGVHSAAQLPNLTAYFNQITPENAGKWGSVEATRDVMRWEELDAAHALARKHGHVFRFHVLVWGNQQPEWIETLPPREQREEIEEWFQAVAARYPDLDYVEVVNEPLHDPPSKSDDGGGNYLEALGGGNDPLGKLQPALHFAQSLFQRVHLVQPVLQLFEQEELLPGHLLQVAGQEHAGPDGAGDPAGEQRPYDDSRHSTPLGG